MAYLMHTSDQECVCYNVYLVDAWERVPFFKRKKSNYNFKKTIFEFNLNEKKIKWEKDSQNKI